MSGLRAGNISMQKTMGSGSGRTQCRYSVVMAMFNAQETVTKAVNSVQSQSLDDWELVIVDDGSIDNSRNVIQQLAQTDGRIRLLSQRRSGPGAARNLALKYCSGEYIAFLDSDDYWEKNFLESVDSVALRENSDVLFIESLFEREDGSYLGRSAVCENKELTKRSILERQMTGLIPWGMGKVFRRCLLRKIRAEFSDLEVGEEAVFSFEIVSAADKISFVDKPIYHYVKRFDGQHKRGGNDPWLPVVCSMSNHLKRVGEYELYESTINSFALRALCISVYRIACSETSIIGASHVMRDAFSRYRQQFDFSKLNYRALDFPSKTVFALLKIHLYIAVILISRLRMRR